jgi:hypothetical protein
LKTKEKFDRNTSHLAGEFLVAGELARRGFPVSLTFGNAKAVDIYVDISKKGIIKVNAKAGRSKGNWPITAGSVEDELYYIFVFLQTKRNFDKKQPEYFIVAGDEINGKRLIEKWKSREGIRYKTLNHIDYKGRWDKLNK